MGFSYLKKSISTMGWIFERIDRFGVFIGVVSLLFMLLLISIEVFVRKILNSSIYISIEYTGYSLAMVTIFGLASVTKANRHLAVDVLIALLKPKWRRAFDLVFSLLLFLIYSVGLTYIWYGHFHQALMLGSRSSDISHTPLWIPQIVLLLGFIMLNIQLVMKIIGWFRGENSETGK